MNGNGTKTSNSELSSLPITSSHKVLAKRIFGKKMRSVIKQASAAGIDAIVNHQFEFAAPIVAAGLVPIVELEVDIHCPERARAETLFKAAILKKLGALPSGQLVTLKLALPEQENLYSDFVSHPKVILVVSLSGGYSQTDANNRLRQNHDAVARFSRALVEGLSAKQSDAELSALLDRSIQSIYEASIT